MKLKVEYFSAYLNNRLDPQDVHIPLNHNATADLLKLLEEEGSYTILAIRGDTTYEVIKVKNIAGTLVIERGLGGTTPVTHHKGSCVVGITPLMAEAMKEFFCCYNCCEES